MGTVLKALGFLAAGLAVGFAVASWSGRGGLDRAGVSADSATSERLAAVESGLAAERRARLALERQVAAVEERVGGRPEAAGDAGAPAFPGEVDGGPRLAARAGDRPGFEAVTERLPEPVRERVNTALRARGSLEDRVTLFVDAGFAPDRAQWIVERTEALRMETLQARYEAERGGEDAQAGEALLSAEARLRNELGDPDYERYLQALGRPTAVRVNEVLGSSPAEQAGLQPGDEVVAYAGKRVFDMSDLNGLTYEGTAGELVAVEVLRDGQPVQVYVPRGPIGIMGGGRFRGRR